MSMYCRAIPYEGSEPYIFLSYCHEDADYVYPLLEQMTEDRYRVWYDDGNSAGDSWPEIIADHLARGAVCLAILSEAFTNSHNCKSEFNYALAQGIKLVPVCHGEFHMTPGMRMQLSAIHFLKDLDFSTNQALLAKLYQTPELEACKSPVPLSLKPPIVPGDELAQLEQLLVQTKAEYAQVMQRTQAASAQKLENARKAEAEAAQDLEDAKAAAETIHAEIRRLQEAAKAAEEFCTEKEQALTQQAANIQIVAAEAESLLQETRSVWEEKLDDLQKRIDALRKAKAVAPVLILLPNTGNATLFRQPEIVFGQAAASCNVTFENTPGISHTHAKIRQENGQIVLSDAGSFTGTFLDGKQIQQCALEESSIFFLNKTPVICFSGKTLASILSDKTAAVLMNQARTAFQLLGSGRLLLNRSPENIWPDGTLHDPKIHRKNHAEIARTENGVFLTHTRIDGNSTFLNGNKLEYNVPARLNSGDRIRLGDTTLEFLTFDL